MATTNHRELKAIVQALFTESPAQPSEIDGSLSCRWCHAMMSGDLSMFEPHREDCLWSIAKATVEAPDDGCLVKVGSNEPIFVLRAQDMIAPGIVRAWAIRLHEWRCPAFPYHYFIECPLPKVQEALALASQMECWPTRKVPD